MLEYNDLVTLSTHPKVQVIIAQYETEGRDASLLIGSCQGIGVSDTAADVPSAQPWL